MWSAVSVCLPLHLLYLDMHERAEATCVLQSSWLLLTVLQMFPAVSEKSSQAEQFQVLMEQPQRCWESDICNSTKTKTLHEILHFPSHPPTRWSGTSHPVQVTCRPLPLTTPSSVQLHACPRQIKKCNATKSVSACPCIWVIALYCRVHDQFVLFPNSRDDWSPKCLFLLSKPSEFSQHNVSDSAYTLHSPPVSGIFLQVMLFFCTF